MSGGTKRPVSKSALRRSGIPPQGTTLTRFLAAISRMSPPGMTPQTATRLVRASWASDCDSINLLMQMSSIG